ncbi:hypothetical protein JWG44_05580 [Leptospira sp. 201903071]|uniref:hypothetical protein n=1 Tax=Leptospira ainazelensis TaxID=2810034 RepID=UPI001966ACEA|nr:hypothetical protein [Leptospira ainazelensis]MBM9499721.1 hypothetical protein [Leptospira ainazelensis]
MRIHICDICNKRERWNDSWSWKIVFGDLEDFREEIAFIICSEECKIKSDKIGMENKYIKASANRFNERDLNRPQGIVKS